MNDNGSGSAALLAAVAVSDAHLTPARHLRFVRWDAEELGLAGSGAYVADLSDRARAAVDTYPNVDMTGTRDVQQWLVVHDDAAAADAFEAYFADRKLPTSDIGTGGSDHDTFARAGIPVGGFTSGNNGCLHTACDDLTNVDPGNETVSANAVTDVVRRLAAG